MLDLTENPISRRDFLKLLTLHLREKDYSQTAIKLLDLLVHAMVRSPLIHRVPKLLHMPEEDLAASCRSDVRQIRLALAELEAAELIKRVQILEARTDNGDCVSISCFDLRPAFDIYQNHCS